VNENVYNGQKKLNAGNKSFMAHDSVKINANTEKKNSKGYYRIPLRFVSVILETPFNPLTPNLPKLGGSLQL
jgi:hypothetical protein